MISLVTGGCGFIGSHMVDRLLEEGHMFNDVDYVFHFATLSDMRFHPAAADSIYVD